MNCNLCKCPANDFHVFHTGLSNWFVGTGYTISFKCEVEHLFRNKSLQSIYLGEQMSLFIALYVFFLWDSSFHLIILFSSTPTVW